MDRDRRLRLIASVYGLDEARLLELLARRTDVLRRRIVDGALAGREPWVAQFRDGHHHARAQATAFLVDHLERWRHALVDGC